MEVAREFGKNCCMQRRVWTRSSGPVEKDPDLLAGEDLPDTEVPIVSEVRRSEGSDPDLPSSQDLTGWPPVPVHFEQRSEEEERGGGREITEGKEKTKKNKGNKVCASGRWMPFTVSATAWTEVAAHGYLVHSSW